VQITADRVEPQLSIYAPPDVHEAIARQLAVITRLGTSLASRAPAAPSMVSVPAAPAVANAPPANVPDQYIQLTYVRVDQVEAVLTRLLGARLPGPSRRYRADPTSPISTRRDGGSRSAWTGNETWWSCAARNRSFPSSCG